MYLPVLVAHKHNEQTGILTGCHPTFPYPDTDTEAYFKFKALVEYLICIAPPQKKKKKSVKLILNIVDNLQLQVH